MSQKKKLSTKDLIYAGGYGAAYLILVLVVVMTTSATFPLLYLMSPLFVGILGATVYLLNVTKIHKFGAILILGVLFACVACYNTWYTFVYAIVCALIAELVAYLGKYESFTKFKQSFWVFNLNMVGPFLLLFFEKSQFLSLVEQYSGAAKAATLDALTPSWFILILFLEALVGAFIGTKIAAKISKKHFEKAGLI